MFPVGDFVVHVDGCCLAEQLPLTASANTASSVLISHCVHKELLHLTADRKIESQISKEYKLEIHLISSKEDTQR